MRERNAKLYLIARQKRNRLTFNKRIKPERRKYGLQKARAANRAKGDIHRSRTIESDTHSARTAEKRAGYPPCPHCPNSRPEGTVRAGKAKGIQRYRCLYCRRTYSGPTVIIKQDALFELMCYHCGSTNTKHSGKGISKSRTGKAGICLSCGKKFVQGGLKDLQKYHLLLEKRVSELKVPEDISSEILQMAYEDVLSGKGYCWTVKLNKSQAYKNVRGNYNEYGSDHPIFTMI